MAVTTSQVQQLYIAYFNRPADFFGLTFQTAQANQFGLQFVADQFSKSPEYLSTYAGKGIGDVIDTIYLNLFGRHAEPAGLKFWGDLLADPKSGITIGNAAITIANGALNDDKVSVANKLVAANAFYASLDTTSEIVGYSGDAANQVLKTWMAGITTQASLDAAITPAALLTVSTAATAAHDGATAVTTGLTVGLDNFNGTAVNDTITALIGTAGGTTDTLNALDSINGGAGNNTMLVTDLTGGHSLPAGITVSNVQTLNVISAATAPIDTSTGFTGLANLNILRSSGSETVKAGAGTAMSVVDTAGVATVIGGSTQKLTVADGFASSKAAGAVTVVASAQTAASTVTEGTDVTVTATSAATSTITIGGVTAATAPTGAVNLVQNLVGSANLTGGAIAVHGGTAVNVTVNAATDVGTTATIGAIGVTGSALTTSVNVSQAAVATAAAGSDAVVGVKHTDSLAFSAMTAGQSVTVAGLTFTASGAVTATQAAAAFANLAANATNGSSTLGIYSGKLTSFGSGAVGGTNTDTVVLTASSATTGSASVGVAAVGATGPAITAGPAGVTAADAVPAAAGVVDGAVTISDLNYNTATAGKIATVSLNSYATGSSISSDALATLSLANVDSTTLTVNNHTATTLSLTVSGMTTGNNVNLDGAAATYTTLNLATAGAATSVLNVTAAAVTGLNISGLKSANLTGSTFTALKTVTVSGAAGVTMASGALVTDFNASATSGSVTVTAFDASKGTYEGGSGTDSLTLLAGAAVTKAITLGAGNDTVTLASGTVSTTSVIDGGAGTDTLSMVAADAVSASASAAFATKVIGFETLKLTGDTGTQLVHVDTLGAFNTVSTGGIANDSVLTMDGFTSGGTLTLTSAPAVLTGTALGSYIVSSAAFATPTTDTFNINVSNAGSISAGSVTAAKVETINLTSTDTTSTHSAATNTNSLTLVAADATSIKVLGNANLNLTSANTSVTSVDASGMTAGLTYTTAGTTAETVKGGAAANFLTAGVGSTADVLIGGAGKDVLTANAGMDTLTGGAGNDWFVIATANANVNTYSTITDATKGDMIVLKAAGGTTLETFSATKVVLASTAVFQDYANAVVAAGGVGGANGYIGWFQFGGDTYVVESLHSSGASASFVNGTDVIVKLTGTVDLSGMTLNDAGATVTGGVAGAPILLIA